MFAFDKQFVRRCECLHQAARQHWGNRMLGRDVQTRLAGGTAVTGYTDYTSGDDYRYVDWNRCARLDELLSKQFQGSEHEHVYLLLDCSASMQVGHKFDRALQLTAALAYMSLANQDSVTVTAFADGITSSSLTFRGRRQAHQLKQYLDGLSCHDAATNTRSSLAAFAQQPQCPGLAIVLSDFLEDSQGFRHGIDALRMRHYHPYLVQLTARDDAEPSRTGGTRFIDLESNTALRMKLTETDLENYRIVYRQFCDELRAYSNRYSVGLIQARAEQPFEQTIQKMIHGAACRR